MEDKLKSDVFSKNWQFTYDRKMSYQRIKLFNHGYCHQLSTFFDVKIDSEIYRIKNGNVFAYYEADDHRKAFASIQEAILSQDSLILLNKIKFTIESYYKDFIKSIQESPVDYSAKNNSELIEAYDYFRKLNDKISLPTWLLYLYIEEILTNSIRVLLQQKGCDEKEAEQVLQIISKPSKITPLHQYTKDLYEVVLLPENQQEEALRKITEKYASWGVYDVQYKVPTLSFHKEKIVNLTKKEAEVFLNEIKENYHNQAIATSKLKDEWKKDNHIFALLDLYSLYSDFKDWKNYYREQSAYKMKILFEEIAARLKLTLEQVAFLTDIETREALTGKTKINTDAIDQRIRNSAMVFLENNFSIATDEDFLQKIDAKLTLKDISLIKGAPAYPGIARGIAKIVFSAADADKIKEGDILIASTTRPDYLPFMKKTAAFITNEGGMLSHAAIMARELKKPCIVGTKIATQVLKDGDMVEVDADSGVVKIIK